MNQICSICGAGDVRLIFKATPLDYSNNNAYNIAKCSMCGHGVTLSARYHASDYEGGSYDAKEKVWHRIITPLLSMLENGKLQYFKKLDKKNTRILEIGSGKGRFVKSMTSKGYSVFGIEPSKRSFQVARSLGCDTVYNCTIDQMPDIPKLQQKFDVIILWHVLEHLEKPGENLLLLKNYLSQNGRIIIAVPNFDSWQSVGGKADWYHLDPSRHLSHFTPRSIAILAEKSSMESKRIYFNSFYQDFIGELVTLVNKFLPYNNVIFNFLRLNRYFINKAGKAGAALCFVFGAVLTLLLTPILIPWTLITQLAKRSGTMVAVVGKPEQRVTQSPC